MKHLLFHPYTLKQFIKLEIWALDLNHGLIDNICFLVTDVNKS